MTSRLHTILRLLCWMNESYTRIHVSFSLEITTFWLVLVVIKRKIKESVSNSGTHLKWTPMFEWCAASGSKSMSTSLGNAKTQDNLIKRTEHSPP